MTMAMVLSSSASAEEDGHYGHNMNNDGHALVEMENHFLDDGRRRGNSGQYRWGHHRRLDDERRHVVVDGRGSGGGGLGGLTGGVTTSRHNDGVDADLERFKRETDAAICDLVNGLGSCTRSSCIEQETDYGSATQTMVAKKKKKNKDTKTTIDGSSNHELKMYIDKYRHIKTVPSFDGCTEQHRQQLTMMMMVRRGMVRHPLPTVRESSFEDTRSFLSLVQSSSSSSSSSRDTSAVGCGDGEDDGEGSRITFNDVPVTVSMLLNETGDDDDDDDVSAMQQSFERPPISSRNKKEMEKVDTTVVANNTPVTVMAANEVLMTAAKAFVAKNHKHKCDGDGDGDGTFQQQASFPVKKKGDGVDTHLEGESESASGSTYAHDPILETNDAMIAAVNAFIDKEMPVFEDNNDELDLNSDKNYVPVIEIAYTTNGLMNTVEVVVPSKSIDCCEANKIENDESCCTTTLLEEEDEEDSPVVVTKSMEDQILVDDIQQSYCCSSILGDPSCSS